MAKYPKWRCWLCKMKNKINDDSTVWSCEPDIRCVIYNEKLDCFSTTTILPTSPSKQMEI